MQLSDLQYLMSQLGPSTADILLIIQHSDDQWEVEFEEDLSLNVSWQQNSQSVIFSCGLGCATMIERERVYALLLNANLLLAGISGARLALSQPDEEVMLIGEYPMTSPSLDAMHLILREFMNLALKYAELIETPAQANSAAPAPFITLGAIQGSQRV